jgi:hypothetical protein
MLSKEELLKPRYKVIADYPLSEYKVGFIIQGTGFTKPWKDNFKTFFYEDYPNIFKKLEWWEERKIEDLPEYVRFGEFDKEHAIYKVKYFTGKEVELYAHYMPCGFAENMNLYLVSLKFPNNFPATHEEYEQYQQSK